MVSGAHGAYMVDPRACGVNMGLEIGTQAESGRSPRMRGKLVYGFFPRGYYRSIPAHAG